MPEPDFLESYLGQSTDELLALESRYRIDSLVLAFEQAIQRKAERQPVAKEERIVLAVEAFEREVNNGGYRQLFSNSSSAFVDLFEEALLAIGCPKAAEITRRAIAALRVDGELSPDKVEAAANSDDEAMSMTLEGCDAQFFANDEPIGNKLFEWIRSNRANVRL